MLQKTDLAEYFQEHYGTCALKQCKCLKLAWLGTKCRFWRPTTATTWEELYEQLRAFAKKPKP